MIRLSILLAAFGGAVLVLTSMDAAQRGALLAWIGLHWLSVVPWIVVAILWRRLRSAERSVRAYEAEATAARARRRRP